MRDKKYVKDLKDLYTRISTTIEEYRKEKGEINLTLVSESLIEVLYDCMLQGDNISFCRSVYDVVFKRAMTASLDIMGEKPINAPVPASPPPSSKEFN